VTVSDPARPTTFIPALSYLDPFAALDFLERAFGFERTMVLTDETGALGHAQMSFGEGTVMIGSEWNENRRSPKSLGGKCTQTVHVHLADGIDAHCARAEAAGAVIEARPEDQFYGDRTYRAIDPEGHVWTFSQAVRAVSRAEAEAASGLTIDAPTWS
jgi:uncharacterized glyoxalase superfamily protein PhnB